MLAQIAQVAAEQPALYTYGPLGIFCAYFIYRDERRAKDAKERDDKTSNDYRSLGHRMDGLTKALLVDMTERESCGIHVKKYAREEISKIDARSPKP